MRDCNRCHKKEGIHRWGSWWLCEKCHELYLKKRQSNDKDPTINIPEKTEHPFTAGWYRQGKGEIYLIESPLSVEGVINHEFIHHVLNIFINPQMSYNYDNIDGYVDDYHSLS